MIKARFKTAKARQISEAVEQAATEAAAKAAVEEAVKSASIEPRLREEALLEGLREESEQSEESEQTEQTEESERLEESEQTEPSEPSEESGQSEESEQSDNSETSENSDNSEESEGAMWRAVEEAYCLGAGIDGETLARAKELLKGMGAGSKGGCYSPSALQMALRLLRYDEEIKEAHRRGYEAGRAEEIAAAFRGKRLRAEEAASLPHFGGVPELNNNETSIFDIARGQ